MLSFTFYSLCITLSLDQCVIFSGMKTHSIKVNDSPIVIENVSCHESDDFIEYESSIADDILDSSIESISEKSRMDFKSVEIFQDPNFKSIITTPSDKLQTNLDEVVVEKNPSISFKLKNETGRKKSEKFSFEATQMYQNRLNLEEEDSYSSYSRLTITDITLSCVFFCSLFCFGAGFFMLMYSIRGYEYKLVLLIGGAIGICLTFIFRYIFAN